MRIFISTGEVSGDLQGAMLIEALYRQAAIIGKELEIFALGGDRMAAAGATLLGHTTKIASFGLLESVPYIIPTWLLQSRAKKFLRENPPDLLVLIDYIGPNLVIGNYLRQNFANVPIIYYIAPQEWVWSPPLVSKSNQLKKITDHLLAIFPEEARYYEKKGIAVTWVGHPLLDRMEKAPSREQARQSLGIKADETVVLLLPASRPQEIKYLLPVMCEAASLLQTKVPQIRFLIPLSLKTYKDSIEAIVKSYGLQVTVLDDQTLLAIAAADLAITKSGTVNLEIALANVPQVVIYKVNPLTIWIARKLFNFSIPFMSPVNLLTMNPTVPELLQEEATAVKIYEESLELLFNLEKQKKLNADYQQMRQLLGEVGVCDRVALKIVQFPDSEAELRSAAVGEGLP